ncbi:MAG TPA: AI-2E family transporter, partial [Clostridiales bacterium]|nr:AI-2E family transporter [Clostridiales bacterium]
MVLAAGLLYLAWLLRAALVPFVLAAVLAFMLEPPVRFLEARGLSRLSSILVVYAAAAALAGGFLVYLIPVLYRQLTLLAASLPGLTRQVQRLLAEAQLLYSQAGLPAEVRQVL